MDHDDQQVLQEETASKDNPKRIQTMMQGVRLLLFKTMNTIAIAHSYSFTFTVAFAFQFPFPFRPTATCSCNINR